MTAEQIQEISREWMDLAQKKIGLSHHEVRLLNSLREFLITLAQLEEDVPKEAASWMTK